MIQVSQRAVMSVPVERVVRLQLPGRPVVEQRSAGQLDFQLVAVGVQGPVGTVAENVLQRSLQAEVAAKAAELSASQAQDDLSDLIFGLNQAFSFHTGAISAQG